MSEENVAKEILEDYPDGLDIEISKTAFDELSKRYCLKIGIHPYLIWRAFDAAWLKFDRKQLPCSGYIDRGFLEGLASKIGQDIERIEPSRQQEKQMGHRAMLNSKKKRVRRMTAYLKEFPIEDLDRQRPFDEQSFSLVKMGPGEEPFTFFHRIQTGKREKK